MKVLKFIGKVLDVYIKHLADYSFPVRTATLFAVAVSLPIGYYLLDIVALMYAFFLLICLAASGNYYKY